MRVLNPQGEVVTKLAETSPLPSESIYTTLDKDFQLAAQQSMEVFRGAVVVLERDTGRVLTIISTPKFDPNAFEPLNFNYQTLLNEIFASQQNPLLNQTTQNVYPLNSVFKIITITAALESERYTAESTYPCGYHFDKLNKIQLNN